LQLSAARRGWRRGRTRRLDMNRSRRIPWWRARVDFVLFSRSKTAGGGTLMSANSRRISVLAVVLGLAAPARLARAEYHVQWGYEMILDNFFNWRYGTSNAFNAYVVWNGSTAQLPGARAYFVGPYLPAGVQVGAGGPLAGQCGVFCQAVTGAPLTGNWRRGRRVVGSYVAPGTLIATFVWNGWTWVYSGHSCIFRGYAPDGSLEVWSQNWPVGFGAVVANYIRGWGTTAVTDRFAYFVVE